MYVQPCQLFKKKTINNDNKNILVYKNIIRPVI